MSDLSPLLDLVVLVAAALTPALLYLAWIRKTERYLTEAWGPLLGAFAFGAIVATFIAALIEGVLVVIGTAVSRAYPGPEFVFLNGNSSLGVFFLVLVIAPFTEEALKAWGVVSRASIFRVPADGPVFGASVGLGFGFFETLLYGLGAYLVGGLVAGLGLTAMELPSGAGHDAQALAAVTPSGMIFVPSTGGVSHDAREHTPWQDCLNGANVLLGAALELLAAGRPRAATRPSGA